VGEHIPWAVETSRDGERWRFFGKGWTLPGEPLLLHAVPRLLRYKRADHNGATWSEPLERDGDAPMTLVRLEEGTREDLWPGPEHLGLPMLLPGGETGRLLAFEHAPDGSSWRYTLEFRGSRAEG
jgi:hypothetical protein